MPKENESHPSETNHGGPVVGSRGPVNETVKATDVPLDQRGDLASHIGPAFARTEQTQIGVTALTSELLPHIGTVGTNVILLADLNSGELSGFYLQNELTDGQRSHYKELARIPYDEFMDPTKRADVLEKIRGEGTKWESFKSQMARSQENRLQLSMFGEPPAAQRANIEFLQQHTETYLQNLQSTVRSNLARDDRAYNYVNEVDLVITPQGEARLINDNKRRYTHSPYSSEEPTFRHEEGYVVGSFKVEDLKSGDPEVHAALLRKMQDLAYSNKAYYIGHGREQSLERQLERQFERSEHYLPESARDMGLTEESAHETRRKKAQMIAEYAIQLPSWMQVHLANVNFMTLADGERMPGRTADGKLMPNQADFVFVGEFQGDGGHLGKYYDGRHTVEAHMDANVQQMGRNSTPLAILMHEVGHSMHPLGLGKQEVSWLKGYQTQHYDRWEQATHNFMNSGLADQQVHVGNLRKHYKPEDYACEMFAETTRDYCETYVRTGGDKAAVERHMSANYGELWTVYRDNVIPEMEHQANLLRRKTKAQAPDEMHHQPENGTQNIETPASSRPTLLESDAELVSRQSWKHSGDPIKGTAKARVYVKPGANSSALMQALDAEGVSFTPGSDFWGKTYIEVSGNNNLGDLRKVVQEGRRAGRPGHETQHPGSSEDTHGYSLRRTETPNAIPEPQQNSTQSGPQNVAGETSSARTLAAQQQQLEQQHAQKQRSLLPAERPSPQVPAGQNASPQPETTVQAQPQNQPAVQNGVEPTSSPRTEAHMVGGMAAFNHATNLSGTVQSLRNYEQTGDATQLAAAGAGGFSMMLEGITAASKTGRLARIAGATQEIPGIGLVADGINIYAAYKTGDDQQLGGAMAGTAGALAGGAIGSVVPVVGTAIGAVIGQTVGNDFGGPAYMALKGDTPAERAQGKEGLALTAREYAGYGVPVTGQLRLAGSLLKGTGEMVAGIGQGVEWLGEKVTSLTHDAAEKMRADAKNHNAFVGGMMNASAFAMESMGKLQGMAIGGVGKVVELAGEGVKTVGSALKEGINRIESGISNLFGMGTPSWQVDKEKEDWQKRVSAEQQKQIEAAHGKAPAVEKTNLPGKPVEFGRGNFGGAGAGGSYGEPEMQTKHPADIKTLAANDPKVAAAIAQLHHAMQNPGGGAFKQKELQSGMGLH